MLQWARRRGTIVHISEVASGLDCDCICDKCHVPLNAKKGQIRTHHFAHQLSNCDGNHESLMHQRAKELIAENKCLSVPTVNRSQIVNFQAANIEVAIDKFRVDVVCAINNRYCHIEVAVTHPCNQEKIDFFRTNNLPLLEIYLDNGAEFNELKDFMEYVLHNSKRRWLVNTKIESARELEAQARVKEYEDTREFKFLSLLDSIPKINQRELHFGLLLVVNLIEFGIPYNDALVVKSDHLPEFFKNLGLVHMHRKSLRQFAGKKVGFKVFRDDVLSEITRNRILFPHVLICWVEGVNSDDLKKLKDDRPGRWNNYDLI